MPHKTKKQKIAAQNRHKPISPKQHVIIVKEHAVTEKPQVTPVKTPAPKASISHQELSEDAAYVKFFKEDLRKSSVVIFTILALEIGLFFAMKAGYFNQFIKM